ncbi:hypothetical protein [uncultured Sphingomonas sp.]|uniref:hypothetical protein n=1 Tax=uncultured Sphingomonas sp. TaxID=158754 RepID=UPI0025E1DCA2|nr:hypothetical protein [uncultured Sphingomonas sp.]
MACPPRPARQTLRRSLALILRDWSRRAANDNVPIGSGAWVAVTRERAARYYAAIARSDAE